MDVPYGLTYLINSIVLDKILLAIILPCNKNIVLTLANILTRRRAVRFDSPKCSSTFRVEVYILLSMKSKNAYINCSIETSQLRFIFFKIN